MTFIHLTQAIKHTTLLCLLIFVTLESCNQEEPEPKVFEVKYEVKSADSHWHGEYIIETGEKVCNCNMPYLEANWTTTFRVKKPFTLHIDASVNSTLPGTYSTPDITTNIYVNDSLVVSNTSNWIKGVASADYELK